MSSDLFAVFEQNVASLGLVCGERILVAVSGGPDSMALLHLFLRWNPANIGVFHLNHGFREEAIAEAQFVRDYAEKFDLPFYLLEYDLPRHLEESGESKQQGARKIRYHLLQNCAEKHGYQRIALAHHGDDQAETVLMNILRGSGSRGLSGMPVRRGHLIRPLLTVAKQDILSYCRDFHVPYVTDPSNTQMLYFRNRVRLELLPFLAKNYNPQIVNQLMQLADLATEDDLELTRQTNKICEEHAYWKKGQIVFPRGLLSDLSVSLQRRVLRRLVELHNGHVLRIGFKHIEHWRYQLQANPVFKLTLPGTIVSATGENIFVGSYIEQKIALQHLLIPGQNVIGNNIIQAEIYAVQDLPPRSSQSEDFDFDSLVYPLFVRNRQPGDRLQPLGLCGTKKVKDLFIDLRIPIQFRDSLLIICDQVGILWIPGVRRSQLGVLKSRTKRVLRLSFVGSDN